MWFNGKGQNLDLNDYQDRQKLSLILPADCYSATFNVTDTQKEMSIISHSLAGLAKADLIHESFEFSGPEKLKQRGVKVSSHSFFIEPTITGLELFVWAHGMGESGLGSFLSESLAKEPDLEIKLRELASIKGG